MGGGRKGGGGRRGGSRKILFVLVHTDTRRSDITYIRVDEDEFFLTIRLCKSTLAAVSFRVFCESRHFARFGLAAARGCVRARCVEWRRARALACLLPRRLDFFACLSQQAFPSSHVAAAAGLPRASAAAGLPSVFLCHEDEESESHNASRVFGWEENPGKSRKIREIPGKSGKIRENPGKSEKIRKNPKKSGRI